MAKSTRRITVSLPEELVKSLDQLVGRRARRQFLVDALTEKLARVRLAQAAEEAAGSLADVDIPGWETSEQASE
jgi:metal-responsive CopG/Arc/MetJ family transcriptional regulator